MIEIKVNNGNSEFNGEGKGIELIEDCLTIVRTLSAHLATESEDLAEMYEYFLTKGIKDGTLFNDKKEENIFEGKLSDFI